jgi:adenylate kinase family enzyme
MIIEFIGFPGSGKSFLANKLYREFKKTKKEIIFENKLKLNLLNKIYLLIKFIIKNPLYIFTLPIINFKNRRFLNPIWQIKNHRWILNEIIFFEYCKNKNRILIRSEGLHHRLLFLLVGIDEKNFNFFEKILIQYTPIPDKLIMIDIPLKKSIQNTIKRNRGFKYDNQTRSYLKKQSYIFNKIKSFFNRFYKSKFILIKEIKFQNKHIKNLRGCI